MNLVKNSKAVFCAGYTKAICLNHRMIMFIQTFGENAHKKKAETRYVLQPASGFGLC